MGGSEGNTSAYWEPGHGTLQGCCSRGEVVGWRSFPEQARTHVGFSYRACAPSLCSAFSECRKDSDRRQISGTGRFPLPPLLSWVLCVQAVGLSSNEKEPSCSRFFSEQVVIHWRRPRLQEPLLSCSQAPEAASGTRLPCL